MGPGMVRAQAGQPVAGKGEKGGSELSVLVVGSEIAI